MMITKRLYVTRSMGVLTDRNVVDQTKFTKRNVTFVPYQGDEWRVELWCERNVNLTQRKLDHIMPGVLWWIAGTFDVPAYSIMYIDNRSK